MRCVVTGAAGFIGSNLCDRLLGDGHEVVGIDRFLDYYPREVKERNLERARSFDGFSFIEEDLVTADLSRVLDGAEWIFHQAAQAGVRASWGENFSTYTENNIRATQCILEAAKGDALRKTLKKIVYGSSSSIYGNAESLPTFENMRPEPVSPYGVTKLAAEHLMCLYAKEYSVPTVSLRYFTVYGPRQRPDMAFHRFIKATLAGEAITVYGDGEQSRDFTFIEDIIDANLLAAKSDTSELVFNIGGGSRVTVNEVIDRIRHILERPIEVNYTERQRGDAKHTAADCSLAKRELGYAPKTDLDAGLGAEASWLAEE